LSPGRLPEADWDSIHTSDQNNLVHLAHQQEVGPLLQRLFAKSGKYKTLPESIRNDLRCSYANAWAAKRKIFQELETKARQFNPVNLGKISLREAFVAFVPHVRDLRSRTAEYFSNCLKCPIVTSTCIARFMPILKQVQ
jgi:hypothetical protein